MVALPKAGICSTEIITLAALPGGLSNSTTDFLGFSSVSFLKKTSIRSACGFIANSAGSRLLNTYPALSVSDWSIKSALLVSKPDLTIVDI